MPFTLLFLFLFLFLFFFQIQIQKNSKKKFKKTKNSYFSFLFSFFLFLSNSLKCQIQLKEHVHEPLTYDIPPKFEGFVFHFFIFSFKQRSAIPSAPRAHTSPPRTPAAQRTTQIYNTNNSNETHFEIATELAEKPQSPGDKSLTFIFPLMKPQSIKYFKLPGLPPLLGSIGTNSPPFPTPPQTTANKERGFYSEFVMASTDHQTKV